MKILYQHIIIPLIERSIFVASADATANDKSRADFVCDGFNDNVEFNLAIEKAINENVFKIVFSQGNFYLNGVVSPANNIIFNGSGLLKTIIHHTNIHPDSKFIIGNNNIVNNIFFKTSQSYSFCLTLNTCNNTTIQNCKFETTETFNWAIGTDDVNFLQNNIFIKNNILVSNFGFGFGNITNLNFEENEILSCREVVLDLYNINNSNINNNYFSNCDCVIQCHTINDCNNLNINDNVFNNIGLINNQRSTIFFYNNSPNKTISNVSITNNVFRNVRFNGVGHTTYLSIISFRNRFEDATCTLKNVKISDNLFENCGADNTLGRNSFILIGNSHTENSSKSLVLENISINNNIIDGTTTYTKNIEYGIRFFIDQNSPANNLFISDNVIKNVPYGIWFAKNISSVSTKYLNVKIVSNKIDNLSNNSGIYLSDVSTSFVSLNTILNTALPYSESFSTFIRKINNSFTGWSVSGIINNITNDGTNSIIIPEISEIVSINVNIQHLTLSGDKLGAIGFVSKSGNSFTIRNKSGVNDANAFWTAIVR